MRGAAWEEERITSINGCQAGMAVARAMPGQQQLANVSVQSTHVQTRTHTHRRRRNRSTCFGASLPLSTVVRSVPVDRRPALTGIWDAAPRNVSVVTKPTLSSGMQGYTWNVLFTTTAMSNATSYNNKNSLTCINKYQTVSKITTDFIRSICLCRFNKLGVITS